MIAQIYPLKRMPRSVKVFDYEVPENLSPLLRGQLVTIPFRQSVLYGIVARVQEKPKRGILLKSIISIEPHYALSDAELIFFESMAYELVQSVSSFLYACLPKIPKHIRTTKKTVQEIKTLTIPKSESESLFTLAKQLSDRHRAFCYQSDLKRIAAMITFYLREKSDQKCIILTPTVLDATRLRAYVQAFSPMLYTSEQTEQEQFNTWLSFKTATHGMLIGTKNTIFLTDPQTTTIFVVRSSSSHHGHHQQNPRFDARCVLERYEQLMHTNLFYFDVLPRFEDLYKYSDTPILGQSPHVDLSLVDMTQEYQGSAAGSYLSFIAQETIERELKQKSRILCVLNKKSRVSRLSCSTCKKSVVCSTCQSAYAVSENQMRCIRCLHTEPRWNICEFCHTATIKETSCGNKKLSEILQNEFPNARFSSIDKEHPFVDKEADIILTTSFYLEEPFNPFEPDQFGVIVLLDADESLYHESSESLRETLYAFEQWKAVAFRCRASLLLQTRTLSLFQEYLENPDTFLRKELASRSSYHLPPFRHICLLQLKETDLRRKDIRLSEYKREIRKRLPEVHIQNMPNGLEIRFIDTEKNILLDLFFTFPDDVIIDMHADSR
ncbi:MAG: hypothetical protein AAB664_01820 [Patescibacteria group bacterium]